MFFQPFSAIYLHLKKQNLENYSLGVHDTTRLSCSSPFNSICDLIHSTEKNIRLGGPSLYIWHLALGSLLCTNFFVLSLVEQRKSILLPQMKKNTHKCNQSNWTISLNLKKKKSRWEPEERGEDKGLTLGFAHISHFIHPSKPGFPYRGELMIMESWEEGWGTPDYYLLHSLKWK